MSYWKNTKELPFFIGNFVQAGMILSPLALIYLILPFGKEVDGHYMSYGEIWKSGAGICLFLFFVLELLGCWGIAARKQNSCWAFIFAPIVLPILLSLFHHLNGAAWSENASSPAYIVMAIIIGTFFYAYLFYSSAMRAYFKGK